ncbi:unnamed protein product, partial [Mesorhabditis belari]|uniref:Transmembrane protein 199 n=1 Tax=Mesorhabditis belari TaxID=2138241 RepID=A0AAF3EL01_9BILA
MSCQFVQTDRSRKCLLELENKIDGNEKQTILREIREKEALSMDDMKRIEEITPKDFPALFALLCEFRRVKEPDYKASAEFRQKTEFLRKRFEDKQYKKLVETIDPSQSYGATPLMRDFGSDMRAMNRQLTTVLNFVVTVGGGFFFGFTGITYAYPARQFDLATRFILGLIPATIIFFADLYFLIKNMDEELAPRANAGKVHASPPLDLKKFNSVKETTPKTIAQDVPAKNKKAKKDD